MCEPMWSYVRVRERGGEGGEGVREGGRDGRGVNYIVFLYTVWFQVL